MRNGQYVILYLDDDQDYLDAMREIVESDGYIMVEARSAEDGLRVYQQENPDLLLVDLMMEEVDAGTSFVQDVRGLGNTAPIYLLSSLGDALTLTTDTGEIGLTGVLQKPVNPSMLLDLLRAQLKPAPADRAPGGDRPPEARS